MIPGVILAAGKSTRMGRSKATLPIGPNDTFLTRIVRTLVAAGVEDVVVVLGHEPQQVLESLAGLDLPIRVVLNPLYESGQLSSVLTGLRAIDRPGVNAMLLTLVDVPLGSAATARAVLARHHETGAPIIRPVSPANPANLVNPVNPVNPVRHGHPIVVDRSMFPLLRSADPALGMKPIVRAHVSAVGDVEVDDEGAFLDIDTPEVYRTLEAGGWRPEAGGGRLEAGG